MVTALTRTISIEAPWQQVFAYLVEPYNLPNWSIVDVTMVTAGEAGWWKVKTPAGQAMLRIRSHDTFGVLDYEFNFIDASWLLPSRILARGSGCEYVMTVLAPESLAADLFEHQLTLVDQKLGHLKVLMERVSSHAERPP